MVSILGWLVAGCLGLVAAWLALVVVEQRTAAREQRIRAEEAEAWANEYARERDVLDGVCARLRAELAQLQRHSTQRTRESLAANFWLIASNVEHKRRQLGHD